MVRRRSHRSTRTPEMVETSSAGMVIATNVMAKSVVEPVVRRTQMPSAKLDRREPTAEIN